MDRRTRHAGEQVQQQNASLAQKQAKIRIASIATDFCISELIVEIKADRGEPSFLSSRKF